ncbi:unnamed protein product [Urochloa decumbens]|uniref:Inner centromere protein ARK-binding domain-containing protein n=1 Tax=Urochloa decumbens TaxID=240449 RepID=A0ABC9BS01_9POAL
MEALFMRAFEIRDAAEAQMRQQVASHSHTLARSLLAAGHLPPPWLLPHPAALAKPDPRGAVEAQMRQQVDSYSQFLAGTLLAVGHRPPAWLQHPADVDTHGNTVTNDPRNVDHLHNLLTEINHQAEQKTLEVGVKPDIMNIATSAHRCQKCASETVTDSTGMHSSNENPSPANSLEVPYSGVSLLLQNETLHPVQVGFCEVSQPIAILLPEKETTCAAESEPLEDPRSSTTPLLEIAGNAVRKVSADIANQKCENHLHHVLPEVNHWEKTPEAVNVKRVIMDITSSAESNQCQKCTRETVIDSMGSDDPSANSVEVPHPALSSPANSLEVPHSDVSLLLQNETPHPVQAGFCEVPQPITILLPEKETTSASESELLEGPGSSTTPLLETAGNAVRKVSADIANQKCKNHLHHVLTEVNHCEKTPEAVNVKRVIMNITSSAEANQCQKCTCGTVIDSMGSEDPSANSVEVPHSALSSLLQNDTLHPFDADFDEAPHPITITLPQIETTHTAETEPVEDPRSIATPLLKIDSLHSGKLNFLEGLDSLAATNPENGSVDTSENDSLELSHSMVSILGEKGTLHSDKGNSLEGNNSIASLLLDKESILTDSLEGADRAVLEKDTLHCVHTNQHEEHYFISSVLLDNGITDATESESFEGPSSMASPLVENGPSNSTKSNFLEGPDCISSRLPENDAVDTAENVSIEVSQSTTSVQFKKGKLHSAVYIEVLHDTDCSITSLFLEKGSISAESLEGASPLVEKDMSHSAETVFLQGNYSIPRLLLDKEAGHTSETTSLEGPYCLENSSIECPIGGVKTARAEDYCKFDETMQECQRFSIPVPCNSPAINNRASQAFCEATELINLSSSLSAKYKMKPLDGVYQSLPSRYKKLMNRSLSYSIDDTNLLDSSYDSKKFGVFGKYSLVYDGAFKMSDDHTYDSPNAYSLQEDSDVPLTHSVEKNNLENLSGRTGSSSDYLSSIPELACFRIDEDSTSLGENDQMKLSGSIGRNCSRQGLVTKNLLGYPTSIHERKGTSRVGLTAGKSYTSKPDRHVHIRVNQDIKNPKENHAPSIRKDGKVTQPLLDRLSNKTEISSSKSERNRSETISANGCRPRNIVSNMTSFIPLVKQKQRPPTSCVKRNVRVRALEAAEAAKRREEKKQTDREKRKAAVELELVRLKQEKEHRQKQVVQQNKKDADIISRKRQRENDGKRGNGRKKKCVEEAPKHQKQLLEIMHSTNAMTDACPNHTDGKDLVKNLVGVKNQLISDERMESVNMLTASKSNSPKAAFVDWKSEGSKLQVLGSLSDDVDKSYEMSPYEDSDEEDFDNLEHEREIRRTCKLIPSWAQKENLNKILLSNQALDPREVFARKCSFILSDVLTLVIPHGLFK